MIYPPITNLIEKASSRYSLVIATAKRAREISEDETKTVTKIGTKYKENPDYDPTRPYIHRE